MIQLKISGRAGNQFFQYSFVEAYLKKNNIDEKIYISFEHLKSHNSDETTFVNELNEFNIDDFEEIDRINYNFHQKIIDIEYKILLKIIRKVSIVRKKALTQHDYNYIIKLLQKHMNKNGLYYYIPGMKPFFCSKNKNLIFFGSYENPEYFDIIRSDLLIKLSPRKKIMQNNKTLYNEIINNNSVCVTIRRGDFLKKEYKSNYYVCDEKYFMKGLSYILQRVDNPKFIVFSDDIDWCKKNIEFPKGTLFETGNDPIYEKIRLMSSCKHFIISNSTFSWWAQYLSIEKNKIVVAPKIWNNFEFCNPIYCNNWIKI